MVKGAALFLQQGGNAQGPKTPTHHKHAGRSKHSNAQKKLCFVVFLPIFSAQTSSRQTEKLYLLRRLFPYWDCLCLFQTVLRTMTLLGLTWVDLQLNMKDARKSFQPWKSLTSLSIILIIKMDFSYTFLVTLPHFNFSNILSAGLLLYKYFYSVVLVLLPLAPADLVKHYYIIIISCCCCCTSKWR